jgi:hypothetical protein
VVVIHTCFMSCSVNDPPIAPEGLEEEAAVVQAWLRTQGLRVGLSYRTC